MAERRVPVTLKLDDSFTGRMAAAAAAARQLHTAWALAQATWEPHDWGTF